MPDPEDRSRPAVEFLDGPTPDKDPERGGRRPLILLGLLVAAVAVAVVVAFLAPGSPPARQRADPTFAPSAGIPTTPGVPHIACKIRNCGVAAGIPSAGVAAAFTQALPGSFVTEEQTLTRRPSSGEDVVDRRVVQAVDGNVRITLVLFRLTAAKGAPAASPTGMTAHGYAFEFRFRGYYPPTRAQLHRLVGDRRLTSTG